MSELRIEGVHKAFGRTAVLRGVDLRAPQGSLTAVLGPSGCGKTTLLRVVAGYERPDSGTVRLGDVEVVGPSRNVTPERRRVGVVPQEGTLFPHLTVADNVGFGLPRRAAGRRDRVAEMLELVGLDGFERRRPDELSGGQQQRVALARALAPGPEVVLLDEPFSALDAGLRAALRQDVRTALRGVGATAVLVTHDQEEALSVADWVAVMRDGRVAQYGSPETVYREPADLGVARFVGEAVLLDGVPVPGGRVRTSLGDLELLDGPDAAGTVPGSVVLRPEQLLLGPSGGPGIPAVVDRTVFHGHDTTVHLTVRADGAEIPLISRVQGVVPTRSDVALRIAGPVVWFPGERSGAAHTSARSLAAAPVGSVERE